jgi:hypothetical protein
MNTKHTHPAQSGDRNNLDNASRDAKPQLQRDRKNEASDSKRDRADERDTGNAEKQTPGSD